MASPSPSPSTSKVEEESFEDASDGSQSGRELEYFGWVYHLGVNSIGHEYCHLRFLFLRGKYVLMYKRDPHKNPGIKPIRKGVISPTLMVEDLGRKKVDSGEFYVLRFYNRLDETKKGEIACATAGEVRKWMEAFDQAKQQAIYDLSFKTGRRKLSTDDELNLEGHRRRVRRYAHGLKRLIKIGKGPEMLLRKTSDLGIAGRSNTDLEMDVSDAVEAHDWRCVRTVGGIRILEDVANSKGSKTFLLKAVATVDASLDTVFESVLSLDTHKRHEWDSLIGELELVDSVDGHYDVVYGTYEPKNLTWWHSKKDFVFSRQWLHGQDGSYTILQFPAVHKNRPLRSGYQRTKVNPSIWEFRKLNTSESSSSKCLVTQMLEVHSSVWNRFKGDICSKFERTIPYALLCQVAGLKEYFGANPSLTYDSPSAIVHANSSDVSIDGVDFEDYDLKDEFYDALAIVDSVEDEDSDDDDDELTKTGRLKFKNVSWAIAGLALKQNAETLEKSEFDTHFPPITINPSQFHGSLHQAKGETDINCWTTPTGHGFMIRGKNYLKDNSKVVGGDPLLKLLAVDFFKAEKKVDNVALHHNCLAQSEAGKKLPFILIINLQIPAKPNYSLVLYFGAERPISKESLLGRFIDGTDVFRDSRFKLIPSIVEGYWMVKRAVGSKACLIGKAVTCTYLRQDNFLEIDVDVGSSSVARSVIGLVLGYITGLVVDLAILIEVNGECASKRNLRELHAMGLNVLDSLTDNVLPVPINGSAHGSASSSSEDEYLRKELHESLVPSALRVPWTGDEIPVHLHFYYIRFVPIPADREYRMFGLFVKSPLPREAETMEIDLHLHHSRIVKTALVPSGVRKFDHDQIMLGEKFQEMCLKVILDRSQLSSDFVSLGKMNESHDTSSTLYLLLPVKMQSYSGNKVVDWETVERCLASPIFGNSLDTLDGLRPMVDTLELHNGTIKKCDVVNSLVFTPHNKKYSFVHDINHEKNAYSFKNEKYATYKAYYEERGVQLLHPEQPFLVAKRLPYVQNLLTGRIQIDKEVQEFMEYVEEFPPELCVLKIMGFTKDMGSSLTLMPSLMHHVEKLLVAIELKDMLSTSIPEASELRADTVLQALTTQKCSSRCSLERFEVLGDAFLKYVVGRHNFLSYATLDEGQLTILRASIVNNLNLYELAIKNNLQVYIRDELFQAIQFYALGRPCKVVCSVDSEMTVHSHDTRKMAVDGVESNNVKCTKSHRWLSRKTIADVVESLAGAFLVESGFIAATSFLKWIGIQVDFEVSDVQRVCEESKSNMSFADNIDLAAVETLIGYRFQNQGLLLQAFVHPSCQNHSGGCYQRLEFLGDAALEYLITSYLYSVYPKLNPGQLTDLRSGVVNNKCFAYIAVGKSFHLYLRHNSCGLTEAINKFSRYVQLPDSEKDFLEEPACPKILGDIVESCIGAILVDTGFNLKLVWKVMLGLLEPALDFSSLQLNPVRELRELCQCVDVSLKFPKPLKQKEGYSVSVEIDVKGNHSTFSAVNHNSKTAQKMAAQKALSKLKALGFKHKRRSLQEIVQSTRKEAAELIGYNEKFISTTIGGSSSKELSRVSEETLSELSQGLDMSLSALPQVPENTPSKLPQVPAMTASKLPHVTEKTPSKLSQARAMTAPKLPQVPEKTPSKLTQVPIMTAPKLPQAPETSPSKLSQVPAMTAPKFPQVPENTQSKLSQVPATTAPKLPQVPEMTSSKLLHEPVKTPIPSNFSVQTKNEVSPTARMQLYEICVARHWKRPLFVSFKEEGPSHQRMFTFKVILELKGISTTDLECYSEPRQQKKAAQENAAEGALWYLKHLGVLPKT